MVGNIKVHLYVLALENRGTINFSVSCILSPSAFGEGLGRELPETRLGECDSLHSCRELSIHERREQGEGVQTRARIRRMLVKVVVMFIG